MGGGKAGSAERAGVGAGTTGSGRTAGGPASAAGTGDGGVNASALGPDDGGYAPHPMAAEVGLVPDEGRAWGASGRLGLWAGAAAENDPRRRPWGACRSRSCAGAAGEEAGWTEEVGKAPLSAAAAAGEGVAVAAGGVGSDGRRGNAEGGGA
ncbi:hypothetical protein GCM10009849_05950 [Sinomonas flava]|uniref:Uncharacterized protein n=1 Tax=Sinomonas flava TaxID=496857 RepID=A0ABN3BM75_9MICC